MKLLIATAAPYSGLEYCWPILLQAGLAPALATDSPVGKLTPGEWHTRLMAAQGNSDLLQPVSQPVVVGKMWEELVVNLLLANMNQAEWGFADERATWLLRFWAEVDPQTHFALAYVPLGQAIALFRQSKPDASDEDIHSLSRAWVEFNTELLSFAKEQGSRALLFNLQDAVAHPLRLAYTSTEKLKLKTLDWQKLEGQDRVVWPAEEDLSSLRLPNLGAARALQKKLNAVKANLLNPSTQVMSTPKVDKATGGWSLAGLFGSSKQLTQELNQTRFDLQKAQAELTQAQEQITDLQAQQEQLKVEHQRQTRLAEDSLKAEKDKAQVDLKEQQQEGELLLQQLHQVQEELEQIFLNREELKKQLVTLEQTKASAEKAKADAQAKVTDLDKKLKDLDKKAKDLDAAKAKAEAAAAAAEKKAADAQAKTSAADKAKAESDKKAAEADKRTSEAQAKATAAEQAKATADKAKAESDKKVADLAAQLESTKATLPEQTKALQEAQQENELLLKQLHQVQEELESYFLKSKDTDFQRSKLQERLDRVLMRLPTWADAEYISSLEIVNDKEHRCLRLEVHNLWVGQDAAVAKLGFLLGNREGVPYMEFRPGENGISANLLPWPEALKDEQGDRLLLAPGAPSPFGKAQAKVVSSLSASQWRMIKGLLVLIGSQINRLNLRDQADRLHWVNTTRDLTQQLDAVSSGVHFQSAEVMAVTQPNAGTEVMRVAIRDLSSRNTRVPLCVFEMGIKYKTLKSGPSPQTFFMDFRPWKGAVLPFVNYKANTQDEHGEFMRLSFARAGRYKNTVQDIAALDALDRQVLGHLGYVLQRFASEATLHRFTTGLGQQMWLSEIENVGQILQVLGQQDLLVAR